MARYRTTTLVLSLAVIGLVAACGDDDSNTAGTDAPASTADALCEANPNRTLVGVDTPLSGFSFRNAFDPSDTDTYDPSDVGALPGPLMVDTWGDRGTGSHGTLAVFPPGFAAPLHTHTNGYYGVVLRGQMSNPFGTDLGVFLDADDTNNNGAVLLGPGSHWYVPAGSQHTTTCVGPEVCWFYFHSESAFDFTPIVDDTGALVSGVTLETPDAAAVLLPSADLQFAGDPGSFVKFASAWGDFGSSAHGTFGRFNAGAASPVHVHSQQYYGVVISGGLTNPFNFEPSPPTLTTGGYWSVPAESVHVTACDSGEDCLFYFHSRESFDFTPLCDQLPPS